jgi:SAM-dependent methyltransferase
MNFTESEINEIYKNKVKLPEEYFKKYEILPPCPSAIFNYNWDGKDYPRCPCVLDFQEWVKKHNLDNVDHLAVTATNDPEIDFVNSFKTTEISYPPYDLHTISNYYKEEFDFFIFNQTLEHLYNPFEAVKQIYNTIKPGGYVFTSVPTINMPHSTPIHFNGFTPMGLAMLFLSAKFDIIEIGQWGNYDYIKKMFETHEWPDHIELQTPSGIIKNEEKNVCQCWILARKSISKM